MYLEDECWVVRSLLRPSEYKGEAALLDVLVMLVPSVTKNQSERYLLQSQNRRIPPMWQHAELISPKGMPKSAYMIRMGDLLWDWLEATAGSLLVTVPVTDNFTASIAGLSMWKISGTKITHQRDKSTSRAIMNMRLYLSSRPNALAVRNLITQKQGNVAAKRLREGIVKTVTLTTALIVSNKLLIIPIPTREVQS
jgi:hypothetical protein